MLHQVELSGAACAQYTGTVHCHACVVRTVPLMQYIPSSAGKQPTSPATALHAKHAKTAVMSVPTHKNKPAVLIMQQCPAHACTHAGMHPSTYPLK